MYIYIQTRNDNTKRFLASLYSSAASCWRGQPPLCSVQEACVFVWVLVIRQLWLNLGEILAAAFVYALDMLGMDDAYFSQY